MRKFHVNNTLLSSKDEMIWSGKTVIAQHRGWVRQHRANPRIWAKTGIVSDWVGLRYA